MIVFLDDDAAYARWVAHHRTGFVLDGRRKPKYKQLVIHRATCPLVKPAGKRTHHWTTSPHFKAYSADPQELARWAEEQSAHPAGMCPDCRPAEPRADNAEAHLSPLSREILDYITDAAVIHMEHALPPYRLTVGDIAACFAKTPGQVEAVLRTIAGAGFIEPASSPRGFSVKSLVFPTVAGMRAMNAMLDDADAAIEQELAKLKSD